MSLLDIAKLPTAANSAIRLHPSDNIAVARVPLSAGQELEFPPDVSITVRGNVPAGHKVALRTVAPGETLIRYGQVIGRASAAINRRMPSRSSKRTTRCAMPSASPAGTRNPVRPSMTFGE